MIFPIIRKILQYIKQTKNKNIDKKSWEYKGPKSSTVFCNENTLKILFKKMITIRIKIKIIVNQRLIRNPDKTTFFKNIFKSLYNILK